MRKTNKITIKSFFYRLKQGDVQFQFYPKGALLPWYSYHSDQDPISGTEYTQLFAGWLFVQCRWTHV